MTLSLVGLSHRVAPVEVREQVALSETQAADLARTLAAAGCEAVCLSTCNRTEIYLVEEDAVEAERRGVDAIVRAGGDAGSELRPVLYRLRDEAAAMHLFRVAAGLDSLIPGEGEILGQVKSAFEYGAPGTVLDSLFRQALHIGKRVRTETAIAESPASVPSAAAALAEQLFGDLDGCGVMLVGAGRMGELAARNLASRGARISYVANRSEGHATALATQFRAEPIGLDEASRRLGDVDVVLSSTSSPGFVVTRADVERLLPGRRGRPLFLIDIAVPRDLDPGIHHLQGCYLYDIDDLEAVVAASLAGRRREAERAETLVAEEADRFRVWQASLDVVPAIASLRARAEEIRAAEVERARNRLAPSDINLIESVTLRIVDKLLHLPTVRLKEAAAGADGTLYVDTVRHLFGLGDDAAPGRHAGE